jgi:Tol biopolymer transport system component|tara:strand:- start:380604 stop:381617 length:1014 start_codon:yes stop_codon:yes gene_type:complete
MSLRTLLILLSGTVFFLTCEFLGIGGSDNQEVDFETPVYANVFFEKNHPDDATTHGIIAINYDNPKEFKLLLSDSSTYYNLNLSPDGEKLLYSDVYAGSGTSPIYGVYNIDTKKKTLLDDEGWPVFGHESLDPVWDTNSAGFYFTNPVQAFSIDQSVLYYNLETKKGRLIKESYPHAIAPLGLLGTDSLFVYSNEYDSLPYYRMSTEGEYGKVINNPYLEFITENGLWQKGVIDFDWNDSLKLITASYLNQAEFDKFKIIVTDLEGTFFKEFTSGVYFNRNPTWTKDGNIIFTEQRDLYDTQIDSELKIIDLETGEIRPFFSKREYPEITGIGTSDQ